MLDVNVVIAGTIWPRWQYEILRHALKGDFQLVLAPLILESARRRITEIDPRQLPRFERFVEDCDYELVDNPTREQEQQNRDLVRSQADVPIALAAINAEVDYFVTYDTDFTDEGETTEKVQQAIPGIVICPRCFYGMCWAGRARNWKQFGIGTGMISRSRISKQKDRGSLAGQKPRSLGQAATSTLSHPISAADYTTDMPECHFGGTKEDRGAPFIVESDA